MEFKYIKLTQGKRAKVDIEDFERINKFKWHYYKNHNTEYAKCSYMAGNCSFPMARLVMCLDTGNPNVVDHINHNGLDNRKINLRICTQTQNARNVRGHSKKFKHKGINKKVRGNCVRYEVQINKNGRCQYMGGYKTLKEAAIAYNGHAKALYGEYAYLNKVA